MFAAEAERHLDKEMHHPSIPLLQGQFAMFVYQGNLDGGSKSIDYFMHMIATYEDLNNDDLLDPQNHGNKEKSDERLQKEMEGASWVMWGIYCVEWFEVRHPCPQFPTNPFQARITSIWISKASSKANHYEALAGQYFSIVPVRLSLLLVVTVSRVTRDAKIDESRDTRG